MEDVNVKVKSYRVEDHYTNNLSNSPSYYRVRLDSDWRRVGNGSVTDAYFDVTQVFPNHRKDLLKGNWEVHLESFHGFFQSYALDAAAANTLARGDMHCIAVALPDMIQSSNDWVITETGCRQTHILAHVPTPVFETEDAFVNRVIKALPIAYNTTIDKSSVGCKVDLTTFDGIIHIQLQEAAGVATIDVSPAIAAPAGRTIGQAERWQATLVFVKKG